MSPPHLPLLLAAFLLGCTAGLRTLTPPAVLWLMRHRSLVAYLLALLALAEYVGDLHPSAPPRTRAPGLIARMASGAFCGWILTSSTGAAAAGAVAGIVGAVLGAYGGLWLRTRAVATVGRVPAALVEDTVAVAGAAAIVAFS